MILTPIVPAMTSDTLPSGYIASSSGIIGGGYEAYLGLTFNGGVWLSNASGSPWWISIEFPTAQTVHAYSFVRGYGAANDYMPKTWEIQGWDGGAWITLDTQTAVALTHYQACVFAIPASAIGSYIKYRMYATVNQGAVANLSVMNLQFYTATDIPVSSQAATPTGYSLATSGDGLTHTLAFTSSETAPTGYIHDASHAVLATGVNGEKIRGISSAISTHLHVLADGKTLSEASSAATSGTIVPNYGVAANLITAPNAIQVDGAVTTGTNDKIYSAADEVARDTDPGIAHVESGVNYKIHNVALTGTYSGGGSPGFDMVYWEHDINGDLQPRIPARPFNYPLEPLVLNPTVYGYADQYTGSLIASPQVPVPVIVAVDSRDGQHAVLTVTGAQAGTTNLLQVGWWGQNGIQEWVTQSTITGNGSATIDKPQGLYACRVNSSLAGYGSVYGIGNLFYISDATNLTRVRIRDNVARATLRVAHRLGFEAVYESPDRDPFNIWVIPEESSESAGMLGGETGTTVLTIHVPRQVDFPPQDGIIPGARVGINGVWFAFDIRWATETINLAPVFTMNLRRLDISVEYDGADN